MESLLASTDNDQLLPMADYKISGPTASYVTDRQEATFFSNVTEAGPNSVRVVTFNINSDNFIDLNSLHFSFEVQNLSNTGTLDFLSYLPQVLFDRFILTIGGVSCEDILHFNRTSVLFDNFLPTDKRQNNADLGFGTPNRTTGDHTLWQGNNIAPGKSRRVVFKPMISGLISGQNKYLPGFALGQQGLQIQLHCAQAADICNTLAGKSTQYVLKDLRVNCNTIMVSIELMNSYSCLLYTSPSPRDGLLSRMPSSA